MGCCYGCPTDSSLGVTFHVSPIAPNGVALVPVQLLEAAAEFLLFAVLLGGYLATYGVLRFTLEFFRYDNYRGFLGPLSLSQWISIVTVVLGTVLLLRAHRAAGTPDRSPGQEE